MAQAVGHTPSQLIPALLLFKFGSVPWGLFSYYGMNSMFQSFCGARGYGLVIHLKLIYVLPFHIDSRIWSPFSCLSWPLNLQGDGEDEFCAEGRRDVKYASSFSKRVLPNSSTVRTGSVSLDGVLSSGMTSDCKQKYAYICAVSVRSSLGFFCCFFHLVKSESCACLSYRKTAPSSIHTLPS